MTELLLISDGNKLESLHGDESRTRQEIPQTAGSKAEACNCCCQLRKIISFALLLENVELCI